MVNYTYDPNTDKMKSVSGVVNDQTITNFYEYIKDRLTTITHNGFYYSFLYDIYGNSDGIKVGDQSLVSYQYGANNGNLDKVVYGNGDFTAYKYDAYGNIIQEDVGKGTNKDTSYQWYADNTGNLIKHEGLINKLLYRYEYDTDGRLIRQDVEDTTKALGIQRNAYLLEYAYDANDNITCLVNKAGSRIMTNTFTYGLDNLLTAYTMPTEKTVTYGYDSLNRLQQYQIGTAAPITVDYSYFLSERNASGQSIYRTSKVRYETVGNTVIQYGYDKLGNITSISKKQADGKYLVMNSYEYDELNQLFRENDRNQNKTKAYTYDLGGNIISIKEYAFTLVSITGVQPLNTITYEYLDTNWKDKLTSYNGQPITYDAIGNPINYNGYVLGWSNGKELTTLSGNGITASYTYDADGLRATKTVNGIKSTYEYAGGQLLYEEKGNTELHYFYDTNGSLKGIQTVDAVGTVTSYYIITNISGDVTQIYDEAGNLKVSYTYDAWGKILSIKDGNGNEITSDTNIGKLNSLRYKSYYYDDESGYYYCQSRYYNSNWKRWINADAQFNQDIIGTNLFSYCSNDPVNSIDPDGRNAYAGALAGAEAGTLIAPGVGTVMGGIVGGIVGVAGGIVIGKGIVWLKENVKIKKKGAGKTNGGSKTGAKPENKSPEGSGRKGAFNKAKENNGIPRSEQPEETTPNYDKRGNSQPGKLYKFKNGTTIRDDSAGHEYQDDPSQNIGPHFNDPAGNHYMY